MMANSEVAASEIERRLESNSSFTVEKQPKLSNWLARANRNCASINPTYQEVYSFETENHHINICQLDSGFYYHRQSKLNQGNVILIPAQAVPHGNVFQANDGRTTYFVGKNGSRYYSSVMQNNNEIVFEPELQLPSPDLPQDLAEANSSLPTALNTNQTNNASLELDSPVDNSEQVLICALEQSAFNSHLDGWQKLIGKSTKTANRYAIRNGHDFVYSDQTPHIASIVTKDGAIINLKIIPLSKTIERVCIQSEAKN